MREGNGGVHQLICVRWPSVDDAGAVAFALRGIIQYDGQGLASSVVLLRMLSEQNQPPGAGVFRV